MNHDLDSMGWGCRLLLLFSVLGSVAVAMFLLFHLYGLVHEFAGRVAGALR